VTHVDGNVSLLREGLALIEGLDPDLYARREERIRSSGIGVHFRHVLDFYDGFLGGLRRGAENDATPRVDYDLRRRDPLTERDPQRAIARTREITERLAAPALREDEQAPLLVRQNADEGGPWSGSTVGRELQALLSHTVHHFALIAVILRLNGVEPGAGFGVAPSTTRYLEERGAGLPD